MINRHAPTGARSARMSWPPIPAPAPRILVVDASSDLRWLYTEALTRPGYEVEAAPDGAAGWSALQARNFQLLITDHELPILTGLDLVRKLRTARMDLPVVMAAASFPTWELARDPSLNLAAFLAKPFGIDTLIRTVRTALRAADPLR